jgi:membrane protein
MAAIIMAGCCLPGPPNVRSLFSFLRYLFGRFGAHDCPQAAAALTFATLIALVPALVMMLGIFGTIPYLRRYADVFRDFAIENLVPDAAGRVTAAYVEQFVQHAGRLTLVGTVLLALSVFTLLLMLDRTLNDIWQVPRLRPLWQRALQSSIFVLVGPLFLALSLSLGTEVLSLILGKVMVLSAVEEFLLDAVPVALNAAVLAVVYRFAPKAYIPIGTILVVSAAIAGTLELMKGGFGWYVRHVVAYRTIYGAFAGLPIFLLWLYICWIVVLFGAVLTAAWSHRGRTAGPVLPTPWQRLTLAREVLALLQPLAEGTKDGVRRMTTVRDLVKRTQAGYDELAYVLDELSTLGWVHVTRQGRLAPSRAIEPDDAALQARFLGGPELHAGAKSYQAKTPLSSRSA